MMMASEQTLNEMCLIDADSDGQGRSHYCQPRSKTLQISVDTGQCVQSLICM